MFKFILPLVLFLGVVIFLGLGLNRDPRLVPSPLINKPLPAFELPRLRQADKLFTTENIKGQISLLNVWATWCAACRIEHPLLVKLAKKDNISIYGLNYKDDRAAAIEWLTELGDPYITNGFDVNGRVAIDLGVYGAPETFLIDSNGNIVYKHVGPITQQVWNNIITPKILQLQTTES